jgi:hypothetical protein
MQQSSTVMRAKMLVLGVSAVTGLGPDQKPGDDPVTVSERLTLCAVGNGQPYTADGSGDEDNSFSRWTPCANLDITIQNPALFGKFTQGDKFYLDFTPAD